MKSIDHIIVIIGIITMLIAATLFILHCIILIKNIRTTNWNKCTATILNSKIETNSNIYNEKHENFYKTIISYKYRINNITYYSKRIFYGDFIYTIRHSIHDAILKKYPKETQVLAFYNPKKPSISVLEKGFRINNAYSLIISSCLLILGFIFISKVDLIKELMETFNSLGQKN